MTPNNHRALPDSVEELTQELFDWAEAMFGGRSSHWSFSGVRVNDLHPHIGYLPDSGEMYISLSRKAEQDNINLVFQLAHEICHSLYPSTPFGTWDAVDSTVLNEGVSTYFSLVAVQAYFGGEAADALLESLEQYSPDYTAALRYTSALLANDTQVIKKLRSVQPMLNDLTALDMRNAGVEVDASLLEKLLGSFKSLSISVRSSGAA